jgi:hypothetical protein
VSDERCVQGFSALQEDRGGLAMMNGMGRHVADTAVAVNGVVPLKERLKIRASVLDRTEAFGKIRSIFECFELRFGEWIVIRDMRAAVGFGDVQIDEPPVTARLM